MAIVPKMKKKTQKFHINQLSYFWLFTQRIQNHPNEMQYASSYSANTSNQELESPVDRCLDKAAKIYYHNEILSCKGEILTWMELEGTKLSEISQTKKDKCHIFFHVYVIHRGNKNNKPIN